MCFRTHQKVPCRGGPVVVEDDELLGGENEFIVSTAVVFVAARRSNLAKDAFFLRRSRGVRRLSRVDEAQGTAREGVVAHEEAALFSKDGREERDARKKEWRRSKLSRRD